MRIKVGNSISKLLAHPKACLDMHETHSYIYRYKRMDWRFNKILTESEKRSTVTKDGRFLTGHLPSIIQTLRAKEYKYTIEECRKEIPRMTGVYDGFSIKLRDYQHKAVSALNKTVEGSYFPRGIVSLATNAGKSLVVASLYKSFERKIKLLYLCDTTAIYNQSIKYFGDILNEPIGKVQANRFNPESFTVAMRQTLHKRNDYREALKSYGYDAIVVDEAHKVNRNYASMLYKFDIPVRVALSGTIFGKGDAYRNRLIVGTFGDVVQDVKNEELIKRNISQKPTIHIYYQNNGSVPQSQIDRGHQTLYRDYVVNNYDRNEKMVEFYKKYQETTLVMCSHTKHGENIRDSFVRAGCNVTLIHAKLKGRHNKLEMFRSGVYKILISTMLLKEGVNLPDVRTLILAQAGRSETTVLQLIGRALRADGKNKDVRILDFFDDVPMLKQQAQKRIDIYHKENFEVKEYGQLETKEYF